jgi:hypothetical protein
MPSPPPHVRILWEGWAHHRADAARDEFVGAGQTVTARETGKSDRLFEVVPSPA